MALIKCFTDSHIENIATCLQMQPKKWILIGNADSLAEPIRRYQKILLQRNQSTEISVCDVKKQDLISIYTAVKEILCRDGDCTIDLTGGQETIVMAAGAAMADLDPTQRERLQVVRYDFSQNRLVDCVHDHKVVEEKAATLTVGEMIFLQGGLVYPDSYQPPMEISCDQLDPLWDIVTAAPKKWNRAISVLREFESRADSQDHVFLPLAFLRNGISGFQEKEAIVRELLENLRLCGVIKDHSSESALEYTYVNTLFRFGTLKAGNMLELKTLLEARALSEAGLPYFQDCQMGVNLDWDGILHEPAEHMPETRNEIDVILIRGMVPLFISCKNGNIGEEELYKLHTVATHFGGPHAKKMLIATGLDPQRATANRALTQRAWDMDIFLVADAAELTKEEWKQIFLNAMA